MGFSLSSVRDWFVAEPVKEDVVLNESGVKVEDLYPAVEAVRDDIFTLEMPDLPNNKPFERFDTGGKRYGMGIQLNAEDPLAVFNDYGKFSKRDETPMASMFNYEVSNGKFDIDSWFADLSPKKVSADTHASFEKVWAAQAEPVVEKKSLFGSIRKITSNITKKISNVLDDWIDADAVMA